MYVVEENTDMNRETGEVISATTKVRKVTSAKGDEPAYVKLYLDHLLHFAGGMKTASNLALAFAKIMTYDSDETGQTLNMIYVNSAWIDNYCKKYGITRDGYNKQLKSLINANIVRRVARGTFQMNPNLMAKGDWMKNGIKTLRATYDYVTGTVSTDIEVNEEPQPEPVYDRPPVDGQMSLDDYKQEQEATRWAQQQKSSDLLKADPLSATGMLYLGKAEAFDEAIAMLNAFFPEEEKAA